jgi:8-oxo-dGTP pyrophosphatase MutT (NUDIX family)
LRPRVEQAFHPPELSGLEEAERELGAPLRRQARPVPASRHGHGLYHFDLNRVAEVVMILPRPGGLLLHTKRFYPAGTFRLPTGGVKEGEPLLEAACREVYEETGFRLEPRRFLFHLRYPRRSGGESPGFHSLGFLYPYTEGSPQPVDPEEGIEEFRILDWPDLPGVIEALENLDSGWLGWGRFRAIAHSMLLECRGAHPEWFL